MTPRLWLAVGCAAIVAGCILAWIGIVAVMEKVMNAAP